MMHLDDDPDAPMTVSKCAKQTAKWTALALLALSSLGELDLGERALGVRAPPRGALGDSPPVRFPLGEALPVRVLLGESLRVLRGDAARRGDVSLNVGLRLGLR